MRDRAYNRNLTALPQSKLVAPCDNYSFIYHLAPTAQMISLSR